MYKKLTHKCPDPSRDLQKSNHNRPIPLLKSHPSNLHNFKTPPKLPQIQIQNSKNSHTPLLDRWNLPINPISLSLKPQKLISLSKKNQIHLRHHHNNHGSREKTPLTTLGRRECGPHTTRCSGGGPSRHQKWKNHRRNVPKEVTTRAHPPPAGHLHRLHREAHAVALGLRARPRHGPQAGHLRPGSVQDFRRDLGQCGGQQAAGPEDGLAEGRNRRRGEPDQRAEQRRWSACGDSPGGEGVRAGVDFRALVDE